MDLLTKRKSFITLENAALLAFVVYALFFFIFRLFGPDFDRVPGDFVDARFNNYILEHGFRYLTGKDPEFWNAPFLYPENKIVAWSDNFIGELPVYAAFRFAGRDPETSFQCWMLVTLTLNFLVCSWVLKKLCNNKLAAVLGGFIFAFSLPAIEQTVHAQMIARYPVPLAIYFLVLFLREAKARHLLFVLLSVVVQFYNSVYVGLLLVLGLVVFAAVYILLYFKRIPFRQWIAGRNWLWNGLCLTGAAFCILLLGAQYEVHNLPAFLPEWSLVEATLPHIKSYFLTSGHALSWSSLSSPGTEFLFFWNHFLFVGALAYGCLVALAVVVLWKGVRVVYKMNASGLKLALAFALALGCILLFTMRIHGITLFRVINLLPGYNSLRDICRIINIELFLFAAIAALVLSYIANLFRGSLVRLVFLSALLCYLIHDNAYDFTHAFTFSKKESRMRYQQVVDKVKSHPGYAKYEGFVYMPDPAEAGPIDLDAMLAAQVLGMNTINGYTSTCPYMYCNFANLHKMEGLKEWLLEKKGSSDTTRFLIIR